jgi:hypothetical protein
MASFIAFLVAVLSAAKASGRSVAVAKKPKARIFTDRIK